MSYEIVPAYDRRKEIGELFEEYFALILANDAGFGTYLQMQNVDKELADLAGKYGPPDGRMYLLLCEGHAAGCIALRRLDASTAELKRMYVRSQYRCRGFGRILVEKVTQDARAIGYSAVKLDTLPYLDSAVRLYRRCGFRDTEPYNDSPMSDSIFLRLDL